MRELKAGDRVAVYGKELEAIIGEVVPSPRHITPGFITVREGNDDGMGLVLYTVHPKQCRLLKPRKRRRVWISLGSLYVSGDPMPVFFTPTLGCIEFIEAPKRREKA